MNQSTIIIRNTLVNIAFHVFQVLVVFFTLPIVIHYFGKEVYGVYAFIISIVMLLGFLKMGMNISLVKYVPEFLAKKEIGRFNYLLNNSLLMTIGANSIIAIILLLVAQTNPHFLNISQTSLQLTRQILYIMAIFIFVQSFFQIYDGVLGGIQEFHIRNIFSSISSVGIILAIIHIKSDTNATLVHYVYFTQGALVLSGILKYAYLKKRLPFMRIDFKGKLREFKYILGFNVYQTGNQISDILMYNTDKIILQMVLGPTSVTYYTVAAKPNQLFQQFISLPLSAILPACSKGYAEDNKSFLNKIYTNGTKIYLLLVLPVIFVFIVFMKEFIIVWMGTDFVQYAFIAQLFLATFLVATPFKIFTHMMVSKARVKEHGWTKFIYAFVNVVLSYFLALRYGIIGVVIPTVLYWFLIYTGTNFYLMGKENISFYLLLKTAFPFYLLMLPLYLVLTLLKKSLFINGYLTLALTLIIGITIYWFLYLLLFTSNEEKRNLKTLAVTSLNLIKVKE